MLDKKIVEVSPRMFKAVQTFSNEKLPLKNAKAVRAENIHKATVSVGDLTFDANEESITRMGYYLTNASAQYTKARSTGSSGPAAYTACYTNAMVSWKLADNTVQEVSLETLSEAHKLAVELLMSYWV